MCARSAVLEGGPSSEWRLTAHSEERALRIGGVPTRSMGMWMRRTYLAIEPSRFRDVGASYQSIQLLQDSPASAQHLTHPPPFCNFQFQSHSDGGGCPSATTCPCIASHRMYDIDRATDRHLLESGNTFHQSTSQSINLSISQRPGEGQRPPVFLSPVLSLCDGSAHSIAPCPPMSLASPVQPMEDRGL